MWCSGVLHSKSFIEKTSKRRVSYRSSKFARIWAIFPISRRKKFPRMGLHVIDSLSILTLEQGEVFNLFTHARWFQSMPLYLSLVPFRNLDLLAMENHFIFRSLRTIFHFVIKVNYKDIICSDIKPKFIWYAKIGNNFH